jgi:hypothetical protein
MLSHAAGKLNPSLALQQAKPSQAKPSQAKPSQAKPSQAKPTKLTQHSSLFSIY